MEAGAGAAGDRDEQDREHRVPEIRSRRAIRQYFRKRRILHGITAEDDADAGSQQRRIQEVTAQRAARLQQQPHRHHAGDQAIYEDQQAPDLLLGGQAVKRQHDRNIGTSPDRHADQRQEDRHRQVFGQSAEPHQATHDQRQDQIHDRRGSNATASDDIAVFQNHFADERAGGYVGERYDDIDQSDPDENHEQEPGPTRHVDPDDFRDGTGLVPDGGDQRAHVVHAADEDAAQHNPDKCRNPTEHDARQNRPVDRAGRGDRGEVLPQQHALLGRNIVQSVVDFACRRDPRIIQLEYLFGQVCTVRAISYV